MAFTKITSEDLADKGVVGLPDTPNLSVTALQKKFDEIATDVIVPKFNNLVDELDTYEELVDVSERVKSSEITNIKTDEDENLLISRDNGITWSATASSGHVIEDGNGTPYPSRGRMQFSSNVNIIDEPDDNTTFIQVQSGEKGDAGENATIRIGNVYTSATPEVTNVGSDVNAILDFGLQKGDAGSAATIQVGTVTSGSNASVSNRGTSSNAIFDFVLVKGDKGDPGTSFRTLDVYPTLADLEAAHPTGNSGDAYFVGDSTSGVVYLWSRTNNAWENIGELKGEQGEQGEAATVTIGTVTTLDYDQSAYVTNDGTTEEAIFSFGIPKGVKGDQGNAATIAIGNVTRGDEPSVTNVGTNTNAIFDMVLPKGDKGDPTTVNGKSGETIQLNGADILLTGYNKNVLGEVTSSDTVNQAISKLANSSGGAKIIVSADSESIGNTMTCTKGTVEYTATVGADEKATFTVNDIGTWTIKNVQTEREVNVNVPYFGVYNVALGVGDVIINIIYDVEYVGATFTVSYDGHTKTFVADGTLEKSIVVADYTTYTITNTYDDKTKTLNVTQGGEYEVSFTVSSYNYQGWLDSAEITTSFTSLEEVLASEITVRTLMTKHASVDYLSGWVEADETLITTIIASTNAMKWIGLRDYAYDSLSDYHSQFLASTNWEYILKDKVPTMTSNSAPYGEASASSEHSNGQCSAWKAFNGDNSNGWVAGANGTQWLQYKFVNPINIKAIKIYKLADANGFILQGSNDGFVSDTHDLITYTTSTTTTNNIYETSNNSDYYLYIRVKTSNSSSNWSGIFGCQFYGRSLNVSVPTMTSNNAPFGEIFTDSTSDWDNNATDIYKAFDNNNADWAGAIDGHNNVTLGYDFGDDVVVKAIVFDAYVYNAYRLKNYKIQGSNNKTTWTDVHSGIATELSSHKLVFVAINNSTSYRYYRLVGVDSYGSSVALAILQFYGVSHSEYTNRHWIYDNGLELEELVPFGDIKTRGTDYIEGITSSTSSGSCGIGIKNGIDLTDYTLIRLRATIPSGVCGLHVHSTNSYFISGNVGTGSQPTLGYSMCNYSPYNNSHNVSSINQLAYPCFVNGAQNSYVTLYELWLE